MQSSIDKSELKNISSHDHDAWQKIIAAWEIGTESQAPKACKLRGGF